MNRQIIRTDKSNRNDNKQHIINCLRKGKFDCIHHPKITEDHLYGLHINRYSTRVLNKNFIPGAPAI